jgi:hypothetical protein
VPEAASEVIPLANEAGSLAIVLVDAVARLRAQAALEGTGERCR